MVTVLVLEVAIYGEGRGHVTVFAHSLHALTDS